jgi:hypothetical protein
VSVLHGDVCGCAACARGDLPECECGAPVEREGAVCARCAERALDLAAEIADALRACTAWLGEDEEAL